MFRRPAITDELKDLIISVIKKTAFVCFGLLMSLILIQVLIDIPLILFRIVFYFCLYYLLVFMPLSLFILYQEKIKRFIRRGKSWGKDK